MRATNRSLVKPVCYFLQSVEVHWPDTRHIPSSFFFFFLFFAVYNVQWLSSHFKRTKNRDLSFLRKSLCTRKLSSRAHGINCGTFVLFFFYYFYFYFNRLSYSFIVISYVLKVELQVWDAGHWCLGRFTFPIHYNNTLILPVNTNKFEDEIRQSQSKENRNHSTKIFQPIKRFFLRAGFEPAT